MARQRKLWKYIKIHNNYTNYDFNLKGDINMTKEDVEEMFPHKHYTWSWADVWLDY